MNCDPGKADPINSYALVGYIPGRLGDFMTKLRQELVQDCVAQSHVTVLPPRPLHIDRQAAAEEIRNGLARFNAFELDMPRIRVFEQTSVIFCEIGKGREELFELHEAMNTGGLRFDEPFEYHPHVTLAQGFPVNQLQEVYQLAVRRWKESAPPSLVTIENLTFVQNTDKNIWIDLEETPLRGLAGMVVR